MKAFIAFLSGALRNPTGSPGDPSSSRLSGFVAMISASALSWIAVHRLLEAIIEGHTEVAPWVFWIITANLAFAAVALGVATWDKINQLAATIKGHPAQESSNAQPS